MTRPKVPDITKVPPVYHPDRGPTPGILESPVPDRSEVLETPNPLYGKQENENLTIHQKLDHFERDIEIAKQQGQVWVETHPEVLRKLYPRGLAPADYACYKGVKICKFDDAERIQKRESQSLEMATFGRAAGTLEGRG